MQLSIALIRNCTLRTFDLKTFNYCSDNTARSTGYQSALIIKTIHTEFSSAALWCNLLASAHPETALLRSIVCTANKVTDEYAAAM